MSGTDLGSLNHRLCAILDSEFCKIADTCAFIAASETLNSTVICSLRSPSDSIISTRICCGVNFDNRWIMPLTSPLSRSDKSILGGSERLLLMTSLIARRMLATSLVLAKGEFQPINMKWGAGSLPRLGKKWFSLVADVISGMRQSPTLPQSWLHCRHSDAYGGHTQANDLTLGAECGLI